MFSIGNSIFQTSNIKIPTDAKIIFVADMFAKDYVGGAELTSQALIDSCPTSVFELHARDVTVDLLEQGIDRFWIFGNFSNMNAQLIPAIVSNMKYAVLEYDYKYCKYRSPEKHLDAESRPCTCANEMHGKIVSAFYHGAKALFWMSEQQFDKYRTIFPFLEENNNTVLSSVFDDDFFIKVKLLREEYKDTPKKGWIVLGSPSWIKGMADAEKWCKDNNKEYEVVWNLKYEEILTRLAKAEGFVYLPKGADTCPRMVIEAKLLGCKLHINEFVQHASEEWFNSDLLTIESYLYAARKVFWKTIYDIVSKKPTLSGYTTAYNCISQGYPFIESINSMLAFCDEVCVVDGGSTDGTLEKLVWLAYPKLKEEAEHTTTSTLVALVMDFACEAKKTHAFEFPDELAGYARDPRVKVKVVKRDWSHPRFAVFDGAQKAEARAMCTMEFCWQMDSDEVIHENDREKVHGLLSQFPVQSDILSLPVLEYWGSLDKVRMDIQPWKWRLSRNKPHITHGIPAKLRKYDSNGNLYAAQGTDGCDMIHAETGEIIPHMTFYTSEVENVRQHAMAGNTTAHSEYQAWFEQVTTNLPTVYHFSWFNLPRKIRTYKNYWSSHWKALFDIEKEDTAENNMMFDCPWSEVTDEMIIERAKEMKDKLGGFIWHKKWDGVVTTPHIVMKKSVPQVITSWLSLNKSE